MGNVSNYIFLTSRINDGERILDMMSKNHISRRAFVIASKYVTRLSVHIGKPQHVAPLTPECKEGDWALGVANSFLMLCAGFGKEIAEKLFCL